MKSGRGEVFAKNAYLKTVESIEPRIPIQVVTFEGVRDFARKEWDGTDLGYAARSYRAGTLWRVLDDHYLNEHERAATCSCPIRRQPARVKNDGRTVYFDSFFTPSGLVEAYDNRSLDDLPTKITREVTSFSVTSEAELFANFVEHVLRDVQITE